MSDTMSIPQNDNWDILVYQYNELWWTECQEQKLHLLSQDFFRFIQTVELFGSIIVR